MSREIKFRVWDKAKNEYDTWFNHDRDEPHELKEYFSHPAACFTSALEDTLEDKDFIIQQFTGLKDKNGKEIYEGDLVNFSVKGCPHGPEQEDYEKREVWFDPDSAAFLFDKFYYDGWHGYAVWDIKNIEVVGNIFEK